MKKYRVLCLFVSLILTSLSSCRDSVLAYHGAFNYTDNNGYVYNISTNNNGESTATLIGAKNKATKVVVPDEVNGIPVVGIYGGNNSSYSEQFGEGNLPFRNVEYLELGRNVKYLSTYSYDNSSENYDKVENFDQYFVETGSSRADSYRCTFPKLKKLSLEKSKVQAIPNYYFKDATNLEEIIFNNNLLYICAGAFYGCSNLNNPSLPDSIKYIGDRAFEGCSLLTTDLLLSDSLCDLGAAFANTGIIETYDYHNQTNPIELSTHGGGRALVSGRYERSVNFDYGVYGNYYSIYGACSLPSMNVGTLELSARAISHDVFGYFTTSSSGGYTISDYSITCATLELSASYIGNEAFSRSTIRNIVFKGYLDSIGSGAISSEKLETITMSTNTNKYFVYDNALYENRDGYCSLILLPKCNSHTTLTLSPNMNVFGLRVDSDNSYSSDSNETVYDTIYLYTKNVKGIFGILEPNEEYYNSYSQTEAFKRLMTKQFVLLDPEASNRIKVLDGVLYSDSSLLAFPSHKEIDTFMTDSSIYYLDSYSFCYIPNIRNIKISRSVTSISNYAFYKVQTTNLHIYIPNEVTYISPSFLNAYRYYSLEEESLITLHFERATYAENWDTNTFDKFNIEWNAQLDY